MSALGLRRVMLSGSAVLAFAGTAEAQTTTGTVAGTVVSNTATASYTVNGTAATATSNTATFVVDRKVNLTVVTDQPANTQVNIGQTGAVLRFRVTNNTNGTQDFLLTAVQAINAGILPGVDNFDVSGLRVYADVDGDGVYNPAVDTATFIDELAPDQGREVFIVGDVPNQADANLAFAGLNVQVAAGGAAGTRGAALVPTDLNVVNQDNTVDVVFADNDNDGALGPDLARNGQGWAYSAFEVGTRSLALSVVKTSSVLSDGIDAANPKALPGAIVQYCLTVTNGTLTTPASNLALTDVIPANTTYVPGSITVGGLGTGGVCVLNGLPVADDGSTTTPYGGSYNAATKTITATIPTLLGGTSVAAAFRVTVN